MNITVQKERMVLSEIGQIILVLSYVLMVPIFSTNEQVKYRAFYAHWATLILSLSILVLAFVIQDLSIDYVVQHSHGQLPFYYRVAAVYAGHSGSLLLFMAAMSTWVFYAVICHRSLIDLKRYAFVIGGLLTVLLLSSNPFTHSTTVMPSQGLNPLLQDIGMMIHPPMLYLGYVASIVPFLYVLSCDKSIDNEALLKRILSASLVILTMAIVLGSWWAYRILGWGGYWGWDPVENASLLPWIMQLGLYHAVIAKQKRWIYILSLMGFMATIFSTMMVRGGMLASVHSFAESPPVFYGLGAYWLLIMGMVLYHMYRHIPLRSQEAFAIRLNCLLAVGITLFLSATLLLPWMLSLFNLPPLVLSEVFFTKVMLPMVFVVFYGLVSYLSVSRTAMGLGVVLMLVAYMLSDHLLLAIAIGAGALVLYTYYRSKHWNLSHMAFVLMVLLMLINGHLTSYEDIVIKMGDSLTLMGDTVVMESVESTKSPTYLEKKATLNIAGTYYYPAIRYFPLNDMAIAISDTRISWFKESYVVMSAEVEDGWSMRIYHQYGVRWIWGCAMLMALGFIKRRKV